MRDKGIDYFENTRRATRVQQQYAIDNPLKFAGYSKDCWGITASDGPGPDTIKLNGIERQFFDYLARGVPYGPDDGTIGPWAVVASLPFAPEIVLPAIDYLVHEVDPMQRETLTPEQTHYRLHGTTEMRHVHGGRGASNPSAPTDLASLA